MAKKPAGLIYGVDEKPPLSTLLLLGLQHVSVMSVGWIFVVVIVTGIVKMVLCALKDQIRQVFDSAGFSSILHL
jgi:xanthine/uracil permease